MIIFMIPSIQFDKPEQRPHTHTICRILLNNNYTSYAESEPTYEHAHTKELRHMTSKQKGKSKKTIRRYDEMKT